MRPLIYLLLGIGWMTVYPLTSLILGNWLFSPAELGTIYHLHQGFVYLIGFSPIVGFAFLLAYVREKL